jgi:hypothetical protein
MSFRRRASLSAEPTRLWQHGRVHETARLAGFFAAHGIWSVSEGETLVPLLGFETPGGDRGMYRFVHDDVAEGARAGQAALADNNDRAARAVLVIDAYVHLSQGRTDALIVRAVDYASGGPSFTMAVPYRPRQWGFAVRRPTLTEVVGVPESAYGDLADAFFSGVFANEAAGAVWDAHYDPSI